MMYSLSFFPVGYYEDVHWEEIINNYGGPAYVEREKMMPEEAVALIARAGGLPVLAHPFTVADPEAMVRRLKPTGLVGIEAFYRDNTAQRTRSTLDLAERYMLVATGGSDYHGNDDDEVGLGGVEVPLEAAEKLTALAARTDR